MDSINMKLLAVHLVVIFASLLNRATIVEATIPCEHNAGNNTLYQRYFAGMRAMYRHVDNYAATCLPVHEQCGWSSRDTTKNLPLYVLSVGLEGAGHHLWTEILQKPVFDCVWINGRHYIRDLADGVPRTTLHAQYSGFKDMFEMRVKGGNKPCKSIYDAEDSFPTGAIRKSGRVFMRPDLINIQALDGILFDVKYLIIIRNATDTALSALRRNFFTHVAQELRTVEHTLTYVESALRAVPCNKIFIAHYEHALADPRAFLEPLSTFLELDSKAKSELKSRLAKQGKLPSRKAHKLDQYSECKESGSTGNQCYQKIHDVVDEFLLRRSFMWPTFAANGFDVQEVLTSYGRI